MNLLLLFVSLVVVTNQMQNTVNHNSEKFVFT